MVIELVLWMQTFCLCILFFIVKWEKTEEERWSCELVLWMQTFCPCILLFIVKCKEQKKKDGHVSALFVQLTFFPWILFFIVKWQKQKKKGGHGTHVNGIGDGFAEKKRPNRQRNGKGLYIEGDYQYEGDWLDDKIHGTGIPCHLAESVWPMPVKLAYIVMRFSFWS
jgi:hypothetical protein